MKDSVELGLVVSVAETVIGDELAAAASAGATTLILTDAVDFHEGGGQATIGTETVTYTTADLDTDTLTLASPLVGSYAVEEPVRVSPEARERVAMVQLDVDGEAIEARVPHALYSHLPEGTRDTPERVTLIHDGSEWVVADVLGSRPVITGELQTSDIGNRVHVWEDPATSRGQIDFYSGDVAETVKSKITNLVTNGTGSSRYIVLGIDCGSLGNGGPYINLQSGSAGGGIKPWIYAWAGEGQLSLIADQGVVIGDQGQSSAPIKSIDFGARTITTNASGEATFLHNLQAAPTAVQITSRNNGALRVFTILEKNTANIKVRANSADGSVAASITLNLDFLALR